MDENLLPNVAWSGGHLLIGDPESVKKVRRKLMSASVASSTLKCPAAMAADRLLPREEDPFGDAEIGTAMHAIFEDLYELPSTDRTPAKVSDLVSTHASRTWSLEHLESRSAAAVHANDTNRKNWIDILEPLCQGIFGVEDPQQIIVLSNEQKVIVELSGVPTVCKIDRIDWLPCRDDAPGAVHLDWFESRLEEVDRQLVGFPEENDGDKDRKQWWQALDDAGITDADHRRRIENTRDLRRWLRRIVTVIRESGQLTGRIGVRDYKKGNKPDKLKRPRAGYSDDYGDQQRLYVLAIEAFLGVRPVEAAILFPALAELGGRRIVDITERDMAQTMVGFRGAWDLMHQSADRSKFETRPSVLCSWCTLANSCPNANPRGKSDPGSPVEQLDKFQLAARKQPSAITLGIPTIRPSAEPAEARTENAAGVTVPGERTSLRDPSVSPTSAPAESIPAHGDDLFPVTIGAAEPAVPRSSREQIDAGVDGQIRENDEAGMDVDEKAPMALAGGPAGVESVAPVVEATDSRTLRPAPGMCEESTDQVAVANTATREEANSTMNEQNIRVRPEGYPSDEMVGDDLNLNSWASIACASIANQAYKHLDGQGVPVRPESWSRFDDVLAGIVLRAQNRLTGQATYQAGAQTRLRGLLFSYLERRPFPFGQSVADIEKWMRTAEQFLVVGMQELISLHERSHSLLNNESHLHFAQAPAQQ